MAAGEVLMKSEKKRATMLASTALILSCVTFGAGFICGDLFSEYRRALSPAQVSTVPAGGAVSASAPHAPQEDEAAKAAAHIRQVREQAEQNPHDASLWVHLGNVCYDSGDADGAIDAYRRSLELQPGNADVLTDMGSMYRMKGQPVQAVKIYEQAIALQPGHRNAIFNKGVTLLLDMEQPQNAMAFWREMLVQQPELALGNGALLRDVMHEVAADAAMQLEAHGRYESALQAYAEAVNVKADFLPALVHQAWLLDKLERREEALPLWKKVLELAPDATDPSGKPVRERIR